MLYPFKTSSLFIKLFPHFTWKIETAEPVVYLTFDDGPIPEVTEWVLDTLEKYRVPATFFCVGDNIRKHPEIFKKVLEKGHRAGNHTFNHISGWKTENQAYADNILEAQNIMNEFEEFKKMEEGKVPLFRPPYGRIKKAQAIPLRDTYRVIMWDVLSWDFVKSISVEKTLEKTTKLIEGGSIIVFHDSYKTQKKLREVLPNFLSIMLEKGYTFKLL